VSDLEPPLVTVYSRPGCHLCEQAVEALRELERELEPERSFRLQELDIDERPALHDAYFERIPVILLDGEELCEYVLDEQIVRERLESRR
jgi:glutaredoxin